MRVTLGELLGKITPKEGAKIEQERTNEQIDEQDEAALRVLQGSRRTNGVEVIVKRKKST